MKRPARTKRSKKRTAPQRSARRASAKRSPSAPRPPSSSAESEAKLSFNHAMIYVKDVERALRFYRDLLGFKLIEDFRFENRPVYARLHAPGGDGTIALHQAGPADSVSSDGVRLYFEIRDLDDFCHKLMKEHFYITKLPAMMPWGWRHAYLNDPDGHEISLYWAGENRMKKMMKKAAQRVSRPGTASR